MFCGLCNIFAAIANGLRLGFDGTDGVLEVVELGASQEWGMPAVHYNSIQMHAKTSHHTKYLINILYYYITHD